MLSQNTKNKTSSSLRPKLLMDAKMALLSSSPAFPTPPMTPSPSPYASASAHFSLVAASFPSFTLQIKPWFGDFSLKKLTTSPPPPLASLPTPFLPDPTDPNGDYYVTGVCNEPHPPPLLGELCARGIEFFSGAAVNARAVLPVTRQAMVRFRWGVNFNKWKLLFFIMDKIKIERVEEQSKRRGGGGSDDSMSKTAEELEVLRGICF